MKKLFIISFVVFLLAGCAKNSPVTQESASSEMPDIEPDIVAFLPSDLQNYVYEGHTHFGGKFGYVLRYRKKNESFHLADVYVWPVAAEVQSFAHQDIVSSIAQSSLNDVYYAQSLGVYNGVKVEKNQAWDLDGKVLITTELTMLRGNLASISYIAVTEYEGQYIKVRITMPDNEANRSRMDAEVFIQQLVASIMTNLTTA